MAFSSPMDAAGGAVFGRFCPMELKVATAKIRPRHVTNLTSEDGDGRGERYGQGVTEINAS